MAAESSASAELQTASSKATERREGFTGLSHAREACLGGERQVSMSHVMETHCCPRTDNGGQSA